MKPKASCVRVASIFIIFLSLCVLHSLLRSDGGAINARVLRGMFEAGLDFVKYFLLVFLFLGFFFKIWQPTKTLMVVADHWFVPATVVMSVWTLFLWTMNYVLVGESKTEFTILMLMGFTLLVLLFVPFMFLLRGIEKEFPSIRTGLKALILLIVIIAARLASEVLVEKLWLQ